MKLKNDRPEQLDRKKDIFLQQILFFFPSDFGNQLKCDYGD